MPGHRCRDDGGKCRVQQEPPWINVNPNYKEINAKEETGRETSVFHYYKQLIRLRKENEIIVYGTYELLLPDSEELYVYTRTLGEEKLITICNFTEQETGYRLPEEFAQNTAEILIGNYEDAEVKAQMTLRPYEAVVIRRRQS